jgi:hypothetical protein
MNFGNAFIFLVKPPEIKPREQGAKPHYATDLP